ncbi:NADPH:quinone oxidoreductase-like [Hibiscus syriacus]|uniref:NADPH:quinone oxidoreductase-like n=1 Tax=Hibiscus syriacus TaxID=106335 RepID=A0A6A3C924_HIBSY|nr:NADPH:quinone oxidoreductase-like [Hibiscus syriacus]
MPKGVHGYWVVWLTRMDGHMGLANSVALKLAGVTNLSKDPNGGTIMSTANGGVNSCLNHEFGIPSPLLHSVLSLMILGCCYCQQPDHLLDDEDAAIRKLGVDRAQKGSYRFRSLLSSNALLALGSDWPVTSAYPLRAIRTAMKRIPPGWGNAWIPSERLSLNDALIGHLISAARACFLENEMGSLSTGKFSDFVVLSTDSWDDFATEGSASVNATYLGGVQAYP